MAAAPELASPSAVETASGVAGVAAAPELPEMAGPAVAVAVPRMAVLVAVELAWPPRWPRSCPSRPLRAAGLAATVEEAAPVRPVLVALDWEVASPVVPQVAVGVTVVVAAPPAPPLAAPVATARAAPGGDGAQCRR